MSTSSERTSTPPSPLRVGRLVLLGALVGAASGALEMLARTYAASDPSVARRAAWLLAYATGLYGLVGAAIGLCAGLFARRARAGAAAVTAGVVAACLAFVVLLAAAGPRFSAERFALRLAAVLGLTCAALVVGFVLARLVRGRVDGPRARRSAWGLAGLAGLALVLAWGAVPLLVRRGASRVSAAPAPSPAPTPAPPHILLVVVDTLRADVLSCYGGAARTPHVQRLAERGVTFEQALAPSSWTIPSVASILTSTYPRRHGVLDFRNALSSEAEHLPRALRGAGYHARAVIGNVFLNRARGFARGFDFFDQYHLQGETGLFLSGFVEELLRLGGPLRQVPRSAHPLLWPAARFPFVTTRLSPDVADKELNDWLFRFEPLPADQPLFLYLQYVAPHSPYLEHPPTLLKRWPALLKADRARLWELYLGEVAYTDEAFGELLARLESAGILQNTLVVFTSDHGEEFQEHGGWEHGYGVYQEVVRVPLIVAGPGLPAGVRIDAPVSLVDLAATLLDLVQVERPASFEGRSLAPLWRDAAAAPHSSSVYTEVASPTLNPGREEFALVEGSLKVILERSLDADGESTLQTFVYDLAVDPGEQRPLDPVPAEAAPLIERLTAYADTVPATSTALIDEAELERMRALGYVD